MSVVALVTELVSNFEFVTSYALMIKITDKRISGIHVTLLAVLNNLASLVHKLYIFYMVDMIGIFIP